MLYTLQEAAELLNADQKTLRKWMKDAQMEPVPDEVDQRRRLISDAQLQELAQQHRRTLQPDNELKATVKALQRQIAHLTQTVTALQAQIKQN